MEKSGFTEVQSKKAKKKAKVMAQVVDDQKGRRRGHQEGPAEPSAASPPSKKNPSSPASASPVIKANITPPPPSKFVEEAEHLKHADRVAKAATAGRDMQGSKDLRGLIDSLRTHPKFDEPVIPAEEGALDLLPPQKRNVGKYYHQDEMALYMASAAGCTDVLLDEVTSASTMLKKLSVREYVNAADVTDADLLGLVMKVPAATRQLLLHHCIDGHRFNVVDTIFPQLIKEFGAPYAAAYLHGCKKSTVDQHLPNLRKEPSTDSKLKWHKLCHYHPASVVACIRADLQGDTIYRYSWDRWFNKLSTGNKTALKELLWNGHASGLLLKLWEELPPKNAIKTNDEQFYPYLPTLFTANLKHFIEQHEEQMFNHFLTTLMQPKKDHTHRVPTELWSLKGLPFERMLNLSIAVLDVHTLNSLRSVRSSSSNAQMHINNISMWSGRLTPVQLMRVHREVLLPWLKKNHPNASDYPSASKGAWFGSWWNSQVQSACNHFQSRIQSLTAAKRAKLIQQSKADATNPAVASKLDALQGHCVKALYHIYEDYLPLGMYLYNSPPRLNADVQRLMSFNANDAEMPVALHYSFFERLKPYFDQHISEADIVVKNHPENQAWVAFVDSYSERIIRTMLNKIKDTRTLTAAIRGAAEKKLAIFLDYFLPYYSFRPVEHLHHLVSLLQLLEGEQRLRIFRLFSPQQLKSIAQNSGSTLTDTIFPLLTTETLNAIVPPLMATGVLSEVMRDLLLAFQDLNDPKIRNAMQKGANSNNVAERSAALDSLLAATFRASDPTQSFRTIKFIQQKIKNESVENRTEVLQAVAVETARNFKNSLISAQMTDEHRAVWFEMLQDALESQDLDKDGAFADAPSRHPVLGKFMTFSHMALKRGAEAKNAALFQFGFELQWRMAVFRQGERGAAEKWRIVLPSDVPALPVPEGYEAEFVQLFQDCYDSRIKVKNAEWKSQFSYTMPLYAILEGRWLKSPLLLESLERLLTQTVEQSKKDAEGLHIIEEDTELVTTFNKLLLLHPDWETVPLLSNFFEVMLRSRLANKYVWKYLDKVEEPDIHTVREKKERRDRVVFKLLAITRSAIHLRFVWRHLVKYHQDRLNEFIAAKKTFRGVFFQEPPKRTLALNSAEKKALMLKKRAKKLKEKIKNKGSKKKPKKKAVTGAAAAAVFKADAVKTGKSTVLHDAVEEERKKELDVADDLAKGAADIRDFFALEACYGMHRLLPSQLTRLGEQYLVMLGNNDRPMPERVNAIIRWTLLPTTSYADIVRFFQENEKPPKDSNKKPMAVNLAEALLKGCMRNDEPCAALRFLLSPRFLGSDRARVAVYAVCACVPWMPRGYLSRMLKLMLTGERRKLLKITTYKEIIRLLVSQPTEEHIQMILHEWNRAELHRDVKIAIIQAALAFLHTSAQSKRDIAWQILESAPRQTNVEVLVTLLGLSCENLSSVTCSTDLLEKPRLTEMLTAITKYKVPKPEAPRYIRSIMMIMATGATDADVRFLALNALKRWVEWLLPEERVAADRIIYNWLINMGNPLLNSEKLEEQQLYVRQASHLAPMTYTHPGDVARELVAFYCQQLTQCRDRVRRHLLLQISTSFFNSLNYYRDGSEERLIAPIARTGFFWEFLMRRRVDHYDTSKTTFAKEVSAIWDEALRFAAERPSYAQFVRRTVVENFFSRLRDTTRKEGPAEVCRLVDIWVTAKDQFTPAYASLRDEVVLILLENAPAAYSSPEDLLGTVISTDFGRNTARYIENLLRAAADGNAPHLYTQLADKLAKVISKRPLYTFEMLMREAITRWLNTAKEAESNWKSLNRELATLLISKHAAGVASVDEKRMPLILHQLIADAAQSVKGTDHSSLITTVRSLIKAVADKHRPTDVQLSSREKNAARALWVLAYFQALSRLELASVGWISAVTVDWATVKPKTPLHYDAVYVNLSFTCALDVFSSEPTLMRAEELLTSPLDYFFNWVAAFELREPAYSLRPKLVTAICAAWKSEIAEAEFLTNGKSIDKPVGQLVTFLRKLQSQKMISAKHPHAEVHAKHLAGLADLPTEYMLFSLHTCLDLLIELGERTMQEEHEGKEKAEKRVKHIWRPELEKILDELAVHPEAEIARLAMEPVTFQFIAAKKGAGTASHTELRSQMHTSKPTSGRGRR